MQRNGWTLRKRWLGDFRRGKRYCRRWRIGGDDRGDVRSEGQHHGRQFPLGTGKNQAADEGRTASEAAEADRSRQQNVLP